MSLSITRRHTAEIILVAFATLVLAGCGSKDTAEGRVKPKGRVLENGLPIQVNTLNLPPGDPGMSVTFIKIASVDAGEEIQAQITDASQGTFELIGADGKGIPTGKYRVAIVMAPFGGTDALKGKYSREKSKIEVEVKEGEDLIIDVANFK
jgi:hypothetical protein